MTFEPRPQELYVWSWLPGAEQPVVAGRLVQHGERVLFNYGRSFLDNRRARPIYEPELPLRAGVIEPFDQLQIAGCIDDAGPDAWGQRVIIRRASAEGIDADRDSTAISTLGFLLGSGSDRPGAIDFQRSASEYVPRSDPAASLDELTDAARRVEEGVAFSADVDQALLHGSSIGGARPKALLRDGGRSLIAKFASSTDPYPVVKGEFAAMRLAKLSGLDVAEVSLVASLGRPVLLVERFDRKGLVRRPLVSALTILGLPVSAARYATYWELAEAVRHRFAHPTQTLRELFSRIVFNILVGNTDDHPRNHAAFCDGELLTLTPAYDICPQPRSGGESQQIMGIARDGFRMSQLAGCVERAGEYLLTESQAREIAREQIEAISQNWNSVADEAELTEADRSYFWGRQFLNPYAFEGGFEKYRPS